MKNYLSFRAISTAIAVAVPVMMAGAQAALAEALQFTLNNESSQDIFYLYVSPSSSDTWGEDILGADTVPAGTSSVITIDDGLEDCAYVLLAVAPSGDQIEDYGIDFCEVTSYTVTD